LEVEKPSIEDTLRDVAKQALSPKAKSVSLDGQNYPIIRTSKSKLRQIDFVLDGHEMRGLEQNPESKSRWALKAREGSAVMQFLEEGKYIAVVVDEKVIFYSKMHHDEGP
jgi:hypothetical protein